MIDELRITDLGVISEATLSLHPGLTVVTGETGAGKTMIVTGLGLLLGARADPKAVRSGATRAKVEGRFRLSADDAAEGPDTVGERVRGLGGDLEDDELLVARHLTPQGRSRAYLGGAQVPASAAAQLTADLVTVHGQSGQVTLAQPERQRDLLDRYAADLIGSSLDEYRALFRRARELCAQLRALSEQQRERAREIDVLTYSLDEIQRVDPQSGEDQELAAETARLQVADDLRVAAQEAITSLAGTDDELGGAVSSLETARRALDAVGRRDPQATLLARRTAELSYGVSDLTGDLARYLSGLETEPGRLEQLAQRRFELAGLLRKYGSDCAEVLAWQADAAQRLTLLTRSEESLEALTATLAELQVQLRELAVTIRAARRSGAELFAQQVMAELHPLAMPHARLAFALSETELGPHGADQVDLLFAANPGAEPRSLARVASGGELSRVRLAIEVVLADKTPAASLVFDEVDAGVGGRVAVEIGRRLALLARRSQVVVVTHLAQVAAFADRHFVVVKSDDGQVTTSGVRQVADRDRTVELARMMAGLETTDSALAHAAELVALADTARA